MGDLGWHWTADTHSCRKDAFYGANQKKIWMKINPYNRRQKCRPIIIVSSWGYSERGWQCVVEDGNFHPMLLAICSETIDRPIYTRYTALDSFSVVYKCMTLNEPEYFTLNVVILSVWNNSTCLLTVCMGDVAAWPSRLTSRRCAWVCSVSA